ncbi:acyltransferase domain-containing protein [Actinoplanes sp. TFC3]|uniref:acyltransferase domain-containing protein n=1 Tax=Actinoplanes sp. TFC3 TaxID=1710355 RepID=UPI00082FA4B7|nr:acyltransferase domain-containing protein [Actinoplanes sp. TFC3]
MARKVFMYSGQGSQYYQMTRQLYEQNERYRLWLDYCDEIAEPVLGRSVLEVIFADDRARSEPFDSLPDSSAALMCVEYSLTRLVRELGHEPDLLLGYSLGEVTAAVVAEALSLEDGLTIAVEFGRLLEASTPPSAMLAVVGAQHLRREAGSLAGGCWVTATNFTGNFVLTGRLADVERVQGELERDGVLCQRLPVNFGVHTPLIDPVREQALAVLGAARPGLPRIPLMSSAGADGVSAVSGGSLWSAMRRPVEFDRTVAKLLAGGDAQLMDLGPSATLATFVKYLLPPGSSSTQVSTINRFGNDIKSLRDFQAAAA